MKKRILQALMVVLVLLAAPKAVAQTIVLKPGQGITQALKSAGCRLEWLAKVMEDGLGGGPISKPCWRPCLRGKTT